MTQPVLLVHLLGEFHLSYNSLPVIGVQAARLQSLLTYLILHADIPQSRQRVAFMLWPDTSESQARNNLRQFVYQLRQVLPEPERFLSADTHTIEWKIDDKQIVDIRHFKQKMAEADLAEQRGDGDEFRKTLEQAVFAYKGDLAPDCYDEWIAPERERLRSQYQTACQKLTRVLEAHREYTMALQVAQQLLQLDLLDEEIHADIIRLHLLNNDRSSASRVYKYAVETLARELGVGPGEKLRTVYEHLKHLPSASLTKNDNDNATFRLVGRQPEWQNLLTAWKRAAAGYAHFVLISGEAGIGKSRLAEELFNWADRQGYATAYTRSYGAEGRLSFAPVTDLLRSAAIRPNLATLEKIWLVEIARLLPELVIEYTGLTLPEPISEYGQRRRFFEALTRAVTTTTGPLLLWIDDLHWCDQETLEWLHFLMRFYLHHSLLVLGTARSEETPPEHPLSVMARQLEVEGRITSIELGQLDAVESANLAAQVRGMEFNVAETMNLYRQTEGNPLFVIETTRSGMVGSEGFEGTVSSAGPDLFHAIPARVQAVIAGRLSQLSVPARKVAEIGAAIGRAFSFGLLLQAGHEDEQSVAQALDELWHKRIIREQGINVFDFMHDKLRDVTYAETSAPQRRLLHRRIAQALERLNQDNLDAVSPQVAAQYELAGMFEQALPYYQRAGSNAASVYANNDAIDLFTHSLSLLSQLPAGVKPDEQEINICLSLSKLYRITKGWAAVEVEQVLNRALALCDIVANDSQRARILFGLQSFNVVAARMEKVHSAYPELRRLFTKLHGSQPPYLAINYAGAKAHMGQLVEAHELFAKIVKRRESWHLHDLEESLGMNYLVHALAWDAHVQWCLGRADVGLENMNKSLVFAQEFEHPFNKALALTYMAMLQELCGEMESFLAHAEKAYAFSVEYHVSYYASWADILMQFGLAWQDTSSDRLTKMRDAIHFFKDGGPRIRLPIFYSMLARACQRAGQIDEGLAAIETGFSEGLQSGEHWWDAELHRLRAELLSARGAGVQEVQEIFQLALHTARAQQSKSLELRAALSLARLWSGASRMVEAKNLLSPVYETFTEGFNTPDLRAARKMLDEL